MSRLVQVRERSVQEENESILDSNTRLISKLYRAELGKDQPLKGLHEVRCQYNCSIVV